MFVLVLFLLLFIILIDILAAVLAAFFVTMSEQRVILRGGQIATERGVICADVAIQGDTIVEIGQSILPQADDSVVDCESLTIMSGLVDLHVHLREPGFSAKETIATGTMSAAAGGFTTVCPMPNLNPAPDSVENLEQELELIRRDAKVKVVPYATITRNRYGRELVDFDSMKDSVAGFSDDGSGVQSEEVMRQAMAEAARTESIIAAHCEINELLRKGYIHDGEYARLHNHRGICSESEWGQIKRDIELARAAGCRYHVCHISTKESVELIRQAKAEGVKITCETAPHYLTMCDMDLQEDGRFKMNPPIRSAEDRDALVAGLQDGTIDVIATDHAPHTADEKSRGLELSAMGVVGLETSFAVVYTKLVKTGVISLEKAVDVMSAAPRRIFGLDGGLAVGEKADIAIFDLNEQWTVNPAEFKTMGRATPFEGWPLQARCRMTIVDGKIVYKR